MQLRRNVGAAAAVTVAMLGAAACSSANGSPGAGGGKSVDVVAYSTPQKAYDKLIPAFQQTPAGKGSSFHESFGPSGSQSRAVIGGQHADVVEFSLQTDMEKLVESHLVSANWNQNPYHGFVTDSVAVLVVRKGNPKGIHGWADLVKPGVKVVTPNPESSGSARWNLMAAYGSQIKLGKTPAEAMAYVKQLLQNTVAQPDSGSDAMSTFVSGTGDVLISYENEAKEAEAAGDPIQYFIPPQTILIQNPVAATSDASNPTLAKNFVNFLYSDAGQKIFAEEGYRPVVSADFDAKEFPTPKQLFTIDDLGGWDRVADQFFDPTTGSITKLESQVGASGG